jgi:tetratricopeptide (TPR) repeat protein
VSQNFYSKHKELILKLSSILLVVFCFVALEVILRIISPAKATDSMIDIGPINLFSKEVINGETWYRISNKNAYSDRNVVFKGKKEKDQIRIICLGGSASAGWPHPPDETYSSYLAKSLQKIYPTKKIEIINCSAHGFASYRVRQVFKTVITFKPDFVIIWCGNNEFLERRNYLTSGIKKFLFTVRSNLRTLQLIHQLFSKYQFNDTPDVAETFWKKVNEEALELRSDPEQFEKVKEHYRKSMEGIVKDAKQHNIGIMLMTVPVNLRDWEPNVSYLELNAADSIQWIQEFNRGGKDLLDKKYDEATFSLNKAHKLAPLNAETCFWLARAYENTNDSLAALRYYVLAKDLDYNPFRVISEFNNTIRNIASINTQVVLLDMEQLMKLHAFKGIPGFDLFLDYVHPTKEGNLVITYEIINKIINSNLIPVPLSKSTIFLDEIGEINKSNYTDENDLYVQFTRFSLCCITHQYHSALHFGKILKNSITQEYSNVNNAARIRLIDDAIKVMHQYIEFEQKRFNEITSKDEEQIVLGELRSFYSKYFPYGVF